MDEETLALIRLLLARLERISVDSIWAHRASGVRGALLRVLENADGNAPVSRSDLKQVVENGFVILHHAARDKIR